MPQPSPPQHHRRRERDAGWNHTDHRPNVGLWEGLGVIDGQGTLTLARIWNGRSTRWRGGKGQLNDLQEQLGDMLGRTKNRRGRGRERGELCAAGKRTRSREEGGGGGSSNSQTRRLDERARAASREPSFYPLVQGGSSRRRLAAENGDANRITIVLQLREERACSTPTRGAPRRWAWRGTGSRRAQSPPPLPPSRGTSP